MQRTVQLQSFLETVSPKCYVRLIQSPLFGQLTDGKSHGHFVLGNATAHAANYSVGVLGEFFSKCCKFRIVSSAVTQYKFM
jgi:hypothetical protein